MDPYLIVDILISPTHCASVGHRRPRLLSESKMPRVGSLRITETGTKTGIVIAWLIATLLVSIAMAQVVSFGAGETAALLGLVALIVFSSRVFRSPREIDQPRPWWQMTSRPLSGILLAAVFATSPLVVVVTRATSQPFVVIVHLLIATAYIASTLRLIARGRRRRHT
jgi:hypothetical protein